MATRKDGPAQIHVSEAVIRQWIGEQSFQRGASYFRDGHIFNARRAANALKAECHGSSGGPYRVRATVDAGKIVDAYCSCPVGDGGHCKHVAALLLTALKRPDEVREVEETNAALERRSKEELIALIQQMLRRVPELESLLQVPLPTGSQSNRPVDPKVYQRQVAAAFRHAAYEWGAEHDSATQLSATVEIGDGFLAQGEVANAAAVYQAVAAGVTAHYAEFSDESGALGEVIQNAVDGLGSCLEATDLADADLREQLLNALFEVYHFDVDFGGVGLGDAAPGLILTHASAPEKEQVAQWVRAASQRRTGNEWSDNYHRQVYGGFLLDLTADQLDDEAYLQLCRETHRLNDLVERLLELKRVEEAAQEVARASDYELLRLADLFTRHKQDELVERLMRDRARTTKDLRVFEWLMKRGEQQGDAAGALEWARKLFDLQPSLVQYETLKKLALLLGTWQSLYDELLDALRRQKNFALLTQIYLEEKQIGAALASVEQMQASHPYFHSDLRLQVATQAEATHPREALRIYLSAAEQIIKARNRGRYAQAVQYLVHVRNLYQRLDDSVRWGNYLRQLKEDTKALRAFKEELAKAGL